MMCLFLNAAVMFHHCCLYIELDMEEWVPVRPVLVGKLIICYQRHALQRTEILIEIEMIFYFNCLKDLIMTFFFVKNGMLQICLGWQFKTLCPHLRFQIFRRLTKLWRIRLAIDWCKIKSYTLCWAYFLLTNFNIGKKTLSEHLHL